MQPAQLTLYNIQYMSSHPSSERWCYVLLLKECLHQLMDLSDGVEKSR